MGSKAAMTVAARLTQAAASFAHGLGHRGRVKWRNVYVYGSSIWREGVKGGDPPGRRIGQENNGLRA